MDKQKFNSGFVRCYCGLVVDQTGENRVKGTVSVVSGLECSLASGRSIKLSSDPSVYSFIDVFKVMYRRRHVRVLAGQNMRRGEVLIMI